MVRSKLRSDKGGNNEMEGMYQEKSPGPRIDPWGPPNASQPDGNVYKKDRHRLYNYSVVLKGT